MKLNRKDLYNLEGLQMAGKYSAFEMIGITSDIMELAKRTPFSFKSIANFIKDQIHRLVWTPHQIEDTFYIVEKELIRLHVANKLSLE